MNWKQQWINQILEEIPASSYRTRAEAELRDHLETEYQTLTESGWPEDDARAEALRVMGEPKKLKEEYKTAWQRSLPGRLGELGRRLGAWAVGIVLMYGVQWLTGSVMEGRLFKRIAGDLAGTNFGMILTMSAALLAGAIYLSRKFQTSRRPALLICTGLYAYWWMVSSFYFRVRVADAHHLPLGVAVLRHLAYYIPFYASTFMLCGLLGLVFGWIFMEKRKKAAA